MTYDDRYDRNDRYEDDYQYQDYQESERGVSYTFNENVVQNFTKKLDIDLIARGHQVQEDGY